jgi:hypothetical protein
MCDSFCLNVCLHIGQLNKYSLCEFLKSSNGSSLFNSDQFLEYSTEANDLSKQTSQSHIFLLTQ